MLTGLVVLSALSLTLNEATDFRITGTRLTFGPAGKARQSNVYLPGDVVHLSFQLENLTIEDNGRVFYSVGFEVTNQKGQSEVKSDPGEARAVFAAAGGLRMPASVQFESPPNSSPGLYTLTVTAMDAAATPPKSVTATQQFSIKNREFGIVNLMTTYDQTGQLAAPFSGMLGQSLYVHFWVVDFSRGKDGEPNVTIEMRVIDNKKIPVCRSPVKASVRRVQKGWGHIPLKLLLPLSNPGSYVVELKASDSIGKKVAEAKFDLVIHDVK